MNLVADFQIGEGKPPQVHRHPDRTIERCELRNIPHDVFAPAEQPAADRDQRNDRDRKRDSSPAVSALAGRSTGAAGGDAFDIRRTVVISAAGMRAPSPSAAGTSGGASSTGMGISDSAMGAASAGALRRLRARRSGRRAMVPEAVSFGAVGGAVGISTGGSRRAGGSAPSSERNAATAAVSSAAGTGIAGGMARHRARQRTQRTERPFAPIAISASW